MPRAFPAQADLTALATQRALEGHALLLVEEAAAAEQASAAEQQEHVYYPVQAIDPCVIPAPARRGLEECLRLFSASRCLDLQTRRGYLSASWWAAHFASHFFNAFPGFAASIAMQLGMPYRADAEYEINRLVGMAATHFYMIVHDDRVDEGMPHQLPDSALKKRLFIHTYRDILFRMAFLRSPSTPSHLPDFVPTDVLPSCMANRDLLDRARDALFGTVPDEVLWAYWGLPAYSEHLTVVLAAEQFSIAPPIPPLEERREVAALRACAERLVASHRLAAVAV